MKFNEFFRTIVWALPLTVLIWIYAEREQVTSKQCFFSIEVRMTDSNKIVNLKYPGDPNIAVTLTGPNNVVEQIKNDHTPIQITLPANAKIGDNTFNFLQFLSDYSAFASRGVSVVEVSPSQMTVDVDQFETRQVEVRASAALSRTDPNPNDYRFSQSAVTVRAPSRTFADAGKQLYVLADTSRFRDKLKVGTNQLDSLPLSVPFRADRVTIDPPMLNGVIEIKDGGKPITLASVAVWLDISPTVADQYLVGFSQRTIPNVILSGPQELLTKITEESKPHFLLEVFSEDTNKEQKVTRKLRFANLPDGVTIKNSPEEYTVTFTLTPRQ